MAFPSRRYDAAKRMSLLVEDWVSRASGRQRKGRAGRVRAGEEGSGRWEGQGKAGDWGMVARRSWVSRGKQEAAQGTSRAGEGR